MRYSLCEALAVGAESERTIGAPIRRAMGNLRQVLQHRLMREDVSEDTLRRRGADRRVAQESAW
jgi:hypothetical protein